MLMAEKCCNHSFLKRRLAVVESMVGKSKQVTSILKKKKKTFPEMFRNSSCHEKATFTGLILVPLKLTITEAFVLTTAF